MNNGNTPLVSIVLPTYNVASFLTQCLESINAQTYQNYEVIIIIDGATDGSYEIAKEYCENHEKFSVYWQENAGSGPARNAGLAKASGEFVMFVDPDDWIERDLVKNLVCAQIEKDYDLVATRRNKAICSKDGALIRKVCSCYKEESMHDIVEIRKAYYRMMRLDVLGSPTQKLYKMSIIQENGICFPDLRRSQDVVFNYRYYNYVKSLKLLAYSGYNYRIFSDNNLGRTNADYYKTILWMYGEYKRLYDSWNIEFPDSDFCNFFYDIRIFANLQRCVDNNWDFSAFLEDPSIRHIILNSGKVSFVKRIARFLILRKEYGLLKKYMKIVVLIKQKGLK